MVDVNSDEVKKSEDIEIAGTLFTVHSIESDKAKKNVEQIIKKLILNNVDELNKANLSA